MYTCTRLSRDPAAWQQAPVKGAAEHCRVDKQLRLTLFLNGYSYKAVRHIMRRAVRASFPPADARACSPEEQQVMEDSIYVAACDGRRHVHICRCMYLYVQIDT